MRLFSSACGIAGLWIVFVSGCAGGGCGEGLQPIPGGFPSEARTANGVQARISASGLASVSEAADRVVGSLFPDGLTFDVPQSCGSQSVCCGYPDGFCQIAFDLDRRPQDQPRIEVEAVDDDDARIALRLRTRVKTVGWLPVSSGATDCWLAVNSAWSGTPHMTIYTELALSDDSDGELRVDVERTRVSGLTANDVSIQPGDFLCRFAGANQRAKAASQMMASFRNELPRAIEGFLCQSCGSDSDCGSGDSCGNDGVCRAPGASSCSQRLGIEGRVDGKGLLAALLDGSGSKELDFYGALGGLAEVTVGGLSVGLLSGAIPATPPTVHQCVPSVPAPPLLDAPVSTSLAADVHPTSGEAFDFGFAIHRDLVNRALWAVHQTGYTCINIGTETVPLLNTAALGALIPSIHKLTQGELSPMALHVRPQAPPQVEFGAGTFTDVPGGEPVIDDPLLKVTLPNVDIDFFALADFRYVRLLTLTIDVQLGLNLDIDEDGMIMPVIGDLNGAVQNYRVTNSRLLAESPAELAALFPTIISLALPQLGQGLGDGFAIPDLGGISIDLTPGGVVSMDDEQFLGAFIDISTVEPEQVAASTQSQTAAELAALDPERGAATIAVDLAHSRASDLPIEWQISIDGGLWSPFTRHPTMHIERTLLRLQGKHEIRVRSRHIGVPTSLDRKPKLLTFTVDTTAPRITARHSGDDVMIDARDAVAPKQALLVELQDRDGVWSAVGAPPLVAPAADILAIRVTDPSGNSGEKYLLAGAQNDNAGCGCGASPANAAGTFLLLIPVLLFVRRRRGAGTLPVALAVLSVATTLGCKSGAEAPPEEPVVPKAVSPGATGRWASLATDGSRTIALAYEEKQGDLVLAEVATPGRANFSLIIDGVPEGPVQFDATGYRGGIAAAGSDVGAWVSAAVASGRAMAVYQDRDRQALRFAVESGAGWQTHDIDFPEDQAIQSGMFTSLSTGPGAIPGVAYMRRLEVPGGDGSATQVTSQLLWAQGLENVPSGAAAWAHEVIAEVEFEEPEFAALPTGTGLFAQAARLASGAPVVAYYSERNTSLELALRDDDDGWTTVTIDGAESDRGQWSSVAVSADDLIHLAYIDAIDRALLYRTYDPTSGEIGPVEIIDDGHREGDRPHAVGGNAHLLADGGRLRVVYQDQSTGDVVWSERNADGQWERTTLLGGDTPHGFTLSVASAGAGSWISSFGYEPKALVRGATELVWVE